MKSRSRSPPPAKIASYESDDDRSDASDLDVAAALEGYELKDLRVPKRTNDEPKADDDAPGSDSDDHDTPYPSRARRDSASTTQSFMLYTPDEERAVKRKFDRRLVLFVAFLYMLSFLDRSSMSPISSAFLQVRLSVSLKEGYFHR